MVLSYSANTLQSAAGETKSYASLPTKNFNDNTTTFTCTLCIHFNDVETQCWWPWGCHGHSCVKELHFRQFLWKGWANKVFGSILSPSKYFYTVVTVVDGSYTVYGWGINKRKTLINEWSVVRCFGQNVMLNMIFNTYALIAKVITKRMPSTVK